MTCTAAEAELITGLAASTLSTEEAASARLHLEQCDTCRTELVGARELVAALRSLHLSEDELVQAAWRRERPPHLRDCGPCRDEYDTLVAVNAELRDRDGAVPWRALAASLLVAVLGAGYWQLGRPADGGSGAEEHPFATQPPRAPSTGSAWREPPDDRLAQAEARLAQLEREAAAPQLNVPIIDLDPQPVTRGAGATARVVDLPPSAPTMTFVLMTRPMVPHDSYSLEVLDAEQQTRFVADGLVRGSYDTLTMSVPRSLLPPGTYRFVLFGRRGGDREPVETYDLRIRERR